MYILNLNIHSPNETLDLNLKKMNILINRNSSFIDEIEEVFSQIITGKDPEKNTPDSREITVSITNSSISDEENHQHQKEKINYVTHENFLLTSKPVDSIITGSEIYNAFVETSCIENPMSGISSDEDSLNGKISELEKELSLLNIKKLRRNKVTKEISSITKKINRLQKESDTIAETIDRLKVLQTIESRISALEDEKKSIREDIDEITSINDSLSSLDKKMGKISIIVKERLSEADLEKIQETFSLIRDNSALAENNRHGKQSIFKNIIKRTAALAAFIGTIFIFYNYKNSFNLTGTLKTLAPFLYGGGCLIAADITFSLMRIHMKTKKIVQLESEILEEKNKLYELLDYESNDEPEPGCDLYEYLNQYFEEFIEAEELNTERINLKSRITMRKDEQTLKKELSEINKSLKENRNKIENIVSEIDSETKERIDKEKIIHIITDLEDDMKDILKSIEKNKSIQDQATLELNEYDKLDKEGPYFEEMIEKLEHKKEDINRKIEVNRWLKPIFYKSMEEWKNSIINSRSEEIAALFNEITDHSYDEKVNRKSVCAFFNEAEEIESLPHEFCRLLILLMQYEISATNEFNLPPYIINMDKNTDIIKNIPAFTRIMLELSEHRQVIIFSKTGIPETESCELYI